MKTKIIKDLSNNRILVQRTFDAPLKNTWRAFTESEFLEQWWAPKPYITKTKIMNFEKGGHWLYMMEGPTGDQHWAIVEFISINAMNDFEAIVHFCDAEGNKNLSLPVSTWHYQFIASGETTKVEIALHYADEAQLQRHLEMGFEAGFDMALNTLEGLL